MVPDSANSMDSFHRTDVRDYDSAEGLLSADVSRNERLPLAQSP